MNRTKSSKKGPPNPVVSASLLSKYTFWWLRDLFRKGFSRPLREDEMYEHKKILGSERVTEKFIRLWSEELKRDGPSILRVIFRAYGVRVILLGLTFALMETCVRVAQPLCLGGLVAYFLDGQTEITKQTAYLYGLGIVLCSLISVLTFHQYILYLFETGTKIRLACAGLIYRKTLRISKASSSDGLSGRAINILSNDIGKFDIALIFIHDLWKGPIEAILFGYFMYREIGVPALIGVAFMLSFIPLQAWAAKKAAYYRSRTAERTDLRVKLMNEIIQGIQVIKMYAWEGSFASVINKARRKELNAIRGTVYIHAGLYSTTMISHFSVFLSLISYIYMGDAITAKRVFTVSSYFNILNDSMVRFWPMAITFTAEAYISTKRVREFLLEKECKQDNIESLVINETNGNIVKNDKDSSLDPIKEKKTRRRIVNLDTKVKSVIFQNATTAWESNTDDKQNTVMHDFNIEINDRQLTAVVGPVGSGKSSLLNAIIGELELQKGFVTVNGKLSYACQEPWIFEGSVKDNIIFIDDYDEKRYNEVIHVCALERDLDLFPHGDSTIVGERGVSLSGGQKARVNLARAIYKQADIYLLDDPLSAVDAQVGRHIFDKCIKEFLSDKICILVTHQLQYLKDVEHVIFVNSGRIEAQGSYKDLQKLTELKFLGQTHDESGDMLEKLDTEFQKITKPIAKEIDEDLGEDRKEFQAVGSVGFHVYKSYFKFLGSYWILFLVFFLFITSRAMLSAVEYFISRWVIWEENVSRNITYNNFLFDDVTTYNTSDLIVDKNAIVEEERQIIIITYSIMLCTALALYLARTYGFFTMCLRISLRLHDKLFRGVTRATMSFFNMNPSGRILNRFSKDIHTIDTSLPDALLDCIYFFVDITAVLVIIVLVNYWLIVPAIIVSILFYFMRTIYINTARSVKRIESMTRSPVYSHTNQTFQGLTTIRAFKAEEILEKEFHGHQNLNTGAWYIFLTTTRAFAFWLDIICVLYIAAVTFSFLAFEDQFRSGDVGLAIMQCINMIGMCQWGMRQTAEVENQMTSVERIMEYTELPSEPPLESSPEHRPSDKWPDKGRVKFNDFKLKYADNGDNILKDLNFVIEPKEKIGIVGRTGAGKSSIIQALFRLAINEGSIEVDNIDINTLGLHDLRSKISIIPQDPILFSGTLRYNLDPFEKKKDEEMWKALEDVELKPYVKTLVGGINCRMSDGGSNFSMGQRQLVCLARAILRDNKILILDEATANVDPETDKLIQKTIRTKFANCTVLTIAHRLHTVMDSDRVLVMDAGRAVEIGQPYELLQNSNGYLRRLVDKTGSSTAAILMETARTNYKENHLSDDREQIDR